MRPPAEADRLSALRYPKWWRGHAHFSRSDYKSRFRPRGLSLQDRSWPCLGRQRVRHVPTMSPSGSFHRATWLRIPEASIGRRHSLDRVQWQSNRPTDFVRYYSSARMIAPQPSKSPRTESFREHLHPPLLRRPSERNKPRSDKRLEKKWSIRLIHRSDCSPPGWDRHGAPGRFHLL